jgi:hypothetical protein
MDEFYDKYYSVLGLSPEAGPGEVRAAYRRLIKLYHPDHDGSLDAQIKYAEVRAAYDALHNKPAAEYPRPRPPFHETGFERRKPPPQPPADKKRRPFSWAALPRVAWESVDEIIGVQILLRSAFTCYILWLAIAPVTQILAFSVMPLSLCGAAVFRYYHTRTPQNKAVYFFASLCYGVGLSAIFTVWTFFLEFTWNFILIKFVYHSLVFYMAMLPLWVHPLIWAFDGDAP